MGERNVGNWKNATSESIALIAQGKTLLDYGSVVVWAGKTISDEIAHSGNGLEDLGLSRAPRGFCIWEGVFEWGGEEDSGVEPNGTFRPLTLEEWARLAATGVPWEFEGDATSPRLPSRQFIATDEQRHNDPLLRSMHLMNTTEEVVIAALVQDRDDLRDALLAERSKAQPMVIISRNNGPTIPLNHTRCTVCGIIYETSGMCPRAKLGEHSFCETPPDAAEAVAAVIGGVDLESCAKDPKS